MTSALSPVLVSLLEKSAVDNGFDQELPREGDWLGFASTQCPLRVWLANFGDAIFLAAFSLQNVAPSPTFLPSTVCCVARSSSARPSPTSSSTASRRRRPRSRRRPKPSVADDGSVILANALDEPARRVLGVEQRLRVRALAEAHRVYLPWHRERVFKDGVHRG